MQRARRILSLVLVALVGTVVLGGCRSEPNVAAYLDGKRYPVRTVDHWVTEFNAVYDRLPAEQRASVKLGGLRQLVLRSMILEDVLTRSAAEHGIAVPAPDQAATAQIFGLSQGEPMADALLRTSFVISMSRVDAAFGALAEAAPVVEPTDADRHEVTETLTRQGEPANMPYEQVGAKVTSEQIGARLGLRNWVRDTVKHDHVVVNPKYAPLAFAVPVSLNAYYQASVTVTLATR